MTLTTHARRARSHRRRSPARVAVAAGRTRRRLVRGRQRPSAVVRGRPQAPHRSSSAVIGRHWSTVRRSRRRWRRRTEPLEHVAPADSYFIVVKRRDPHVQSPLHTSGTSPHSDASPPPPAPAPGHAPGSPLPLPHSPVEMTVWRIRIGSGHFTTTQNVTVRRRRCPTRRPRPRRRPPPSSRAPSGAGIAITRSWSGA